jgi:hypothetical protein
LRSRSRVEKDYADVKQRINRASWLLNQWLELLPDTKPEAWGFPSEKLTSPLSKENCWRRSFRPRLKTADLDWANFQVMRRTFLRCRVTLG